MQASVLQSKTNVFRKQKQADETRNALVARVLNKNCQLIFQLAV